MHFSIYVKIKCNHQNASVNVYNGNTDRCLMISTILKIPNNSMNSTIITGKPATKARQ